MFESRYKNLLDIDKKIFSIILYLAKEAVAILCETKLK